MVGSVLGWFFALAAGVAALLFLQRFRAEAGQVQALKGELSSAQKTLDGVQQREAQRGAAHNKRGEEIAELRKRIEKLKKRADQSRSDQEGESGQLSMLGEQLEQARSDHGRAREELESAQTELARAHAELARSRTAHEKLRKEVEERPLADDASLEKLAAIEQKAKQADAAREHAVQEAAKAKHDEARHKKRADNLDKVYIVLRGEHEILKDQSRAQTVELERLRALRVALIDDPTPGAEPVTEQAPAVGVRPETSLADRSETPADRSETLAARTETPADRTKTPADRTETPADPPETL